MNLRLTNCNENGWLLYTESSGDVDNANREIEIKVHPFTMTGYSLANKKIVNCGHHFVQKTWLRETNKSLEFTWVLSQFYFWHTSIKLKLTLNQETRKSNKSNKKSCKETVHLMNKIIMSHFTKHWTEMLYSMIDRTSLSTCSVLYM